MSASKPIILFHPLTVLGLSFVSAVIFSLGMVPLIQFVSPMPNWYGDGDSRYATLFYYHAPIVMAFVVYVCDRAQHKTRSTWAQWALEAAVVGLALFRTIWPWPFYSGHALFLSYALLTLSSRSARFVTLSVLLITVFFKTIFVQDVTLIGGLAIGCLAGFFAKHL